MAASHWPSMMCRSVRQTPAPPILTMTSSGPLIDRLGHLVDHGLVVELVQADRPHLLSSIRRGRRWRSGAAACRGRCRRSPPGWSGSAGPCAGAAAAARGDAARRWPGRSAAARRRRPAGPSSARRSRSRVSGRRTAGPRPGSAPAALAGSSPAASSGRHTWSVPASTALRRKSARSSSQLADGLAVERRGEPGPGRHSPVDRVGRRSGPRARSRPGARPARPLTAS